MRFAHLAHMTSTPPDVIQDQPAADFTNGADALARIAHEFAQAIHSEGNIRVVFGAPMALETHKIIPVATVEIGFGGGMGMSSGGNGIAKQLGSLAHLLRRGFGAGGGAGIKVTPVGFIHEEGERVQFRTIAPVGGSRRHKHRT